MNNEEKMLEMLTSLTTAVSKQGEQIAEIQETLTRVAITQENIVLPRLDTLAEGHTHIVKTLASKAQVEDLSDDVAVIKEVVSRHSVDIGKLKKAQ